NLVGNPLATALIRRFRLAAPRERDARRTEEEEFWAIGAMGDVHATDDERAARVGVRARDELTGGELLRHLLIILAVMGVGALLSLGLTRLGVTLPGYIGAMIVAALLRYVDDRTRVCRLAPRAIEALGVIALALFLVLA